MSFISLTDQPILSVATFQDLPAAALNASRVFSVADLGLHGNALFYSDGTYWRPVNGACVIAAAAGSVTTPIATLPASALGLAYFTTPSRVIIPRGLVYPGSQLEVKARISGVTAGAGSSSYLDIYLTDGITPINTIQTTRAIGSVSGQQYDSFYRVCLPSASSTIKGFFRDWFFNRVATDTYLTQAMPFDTQDIELLFGFGTQNISATAVCGLTSYSVTFRG